MLPNLLPNAPLAKRQLVGTLLPSTHLVTKGRMLQKVLIEDLELLVIIRLLSMDLLQLKLLNLKRQEVTQEIEMVRIVKQKLRLRIRMVLRLLLLETQGMELELVVEDMVRVRLLLIRPLLMGIILV